MAFITYNLISKKPVDKFETREEAEAAARCLSNANVSDFTVVEMDYDPSTTYLYALTLASDGVTLENPYAGQTLVEQEVSVFNASRITKLQEVKETKKEGIKLHAKALLNDRKWKLERARDQDLINGNNNAVAAESIIRNSIRSKSGETEDALNALTEFDDIIAFNHKFSV